MSNIKAGWWFWLVIVLFAGIAVHGQRAQAFETGGDLSECEWEQSTEGVDFENSSGAAIDPVAFAKANGWTCCRLRLLVDGNEGGPLVQSLSYDTAMAKRIKAQGMHYILDIFYSNGWCDPGEQTTPSEWASEDYAQLKATVQSYTTSAINTLVAAGVGPDYVQVGNEISNGMLWPVGSLSNQSQFVGLIQAGIAGVKASNDSGAKIILHCNNAADTSLVEWFYNTIASQCDYDIVGLSYYPSNGTTLSDITSAMNTYSGMFGGRPIMLVEFAYAWEDGVTSGNDYWNIPLGQQECTSAVVSIMKGHSNGDGVMYWGVTYVTGSWGSESLFTESTYPKVEAQPAWSSL
jgi:arabinogalactan endo-1,4-beta-galactosidase